MNTATLERPKLETATVTVQYVNPAKGPKRSGNIKDVDGQIFSVWPNMLAQFDEGETYEIEFTSKVVDGVLYRDVKAAKHITPHGHQASTPPRSQATRQTPAQSQRSAPVNAHVEPPHEPQRQPRHNGNGNGNGGKDEQIFVEGALNRLIQTHQVNINDVDGVVTAINSLREAWARTFGADQQ